MFSITLSNFRSFKDQTFDFDKFNVLIGENSSGKSSLFKFLLAIKQSLQAPSNREINFSFSGEYVDLGTYRDAIYYQQDELPLGFKFTFGKPYFDHYCEFMMGENRTKKQVLDYVGLFLHEELPDSDTQISFELTKDLNIHRSIRTKIRNGVLGELIIEYVKEDHKASQSSIFEPKCNLKYLDFEDQVVYELHNVRFTKDAFLTITDAGDVRTSCEKIYGFTEQSSEHSEEKRRELFWKSRRLFNRIAFLLVVQNYVRMTFDNLEYINPINTHPSRFHITRDQRKFSTINDLDDVLAFFSSPDENKLAILKDFIKILKKLGVVEDLEIIEDKRLPVTELRVKVKDLYSNISDVGYGVSLQLPIILKALLADRMSGGMTKYILIEQPEVHLHPKLHSALVDALMSLSKNTVYFVETHSEHVVRKLQVLVKEKAYRLNPENVTVHYLTRKNRQSNVSCHHILETGMMIEALPSGFYDNSFLLTKQLL
ncbi:AAA family ATPase [Pedobacter sp. UBA4863]|uniref:AAA family ATPase n=1 Tax=Pedobacter sp. UBA4863 TaxID=1947060 RepID=UPI0025DF6DBA|nr:AAA family ATPase [Pedobacter sp. UBA4863]